MNLFETIKAAVTVRQAAERYGLTVNRSSMACCPFHNDRHPSLKLNDTYFYCFGCGAKGDVIDLTAQLLQLSNYGAAQRLAADFGIDQSTNAPPIHKQTNISTRQLREDEAFCFRALSGYLHLLQDWKVRYAPSSEDAPFDDRFVEACQMLDRIDYMTELLITGKPEERRRLVDKLTQEGKAAALGAYVARRREADSDEEEKNAV